MEKLSITSPQFESDGWIPDCCAGYGIAYGRHCYRGPKPPFNWKHRYRFTVYALRARIQLNHESRKDDLLAAMDGYVVAKGELTGTYQRKHKN